MSTYGIFDFLDQSTFNSAEKNGDLSIKAQIEAIVFASPKPVKASDIVDLLLEETSQKTVEIYLKQLKAEYESRQGGFRLDYIKGVGYQFRTVQEAGQVMERLFATRPRPISRAAQETLSIVAYKQPVTRAQIEFIRGVDSGSIIKNLIDRDLIKCVGRKEDAGRPMIFGTTDDFLRVYGLKDLSELPPLASFQPDQETLASALKEIDNVEDNPIDVENIIGDDTEKESEFSSGMLDENIVEDLSGLNSSIMDIEKKDVDQSTTKQDSNT